MPSLPSSEYLFPIYIIVLGAVLVWTILRTHQKEK